MITRLSVIRIYGDSTTTFSTRRHDIQYRTATIHNNLHEKICLRNGRKCTCDPYRPPTFERYVLENPAQLSNISRGDRFSGSLTNQSIVLYCGSQCVCCTFSFSNHVIPCAVRTTGSYEHNRILPKMSVTHYELPVVCTFILHQNGYLVPKSRTRR